MKVTEEWLDLRIKKYEDGKYEAYDALSNERCESADWERIRKFVDALMDNIADELAKQEAVK